MSNIDTHHHCFTITNDSQIRWMNRMIVASKFHVDFQRNVREIWITPLAKLLVSVFCSITQDFFNLLVHSTYCMNTKFDISKLLDICVYLARIGHNDEEKLNFILSSFGKAISQLFICILITPIYNLRLRWNSCIYSHA